MEIETVNDVRLAGRVMREEWSISPESREAIVKSLVKVATSSEKDRTKVAAARVLATMVQTNVSAQPKISQNVNLNLAIEDRKKAMRERLEQLRADAGDS